MGTKKARRPNPGRRAVFFTASAGSVSSNAPLGKVLTGQLRQVENHPLPSVCKPEPSYLWTACTATNFLDNCRVPFPREQPRPLPRLTKTICRWTDSTISSWERPVADCPLNGPPVMTSILIAASGARRAQGSPGRNRSSGLAPPGSRTAIGSVPSGGSVRSRGVPDARP